MPCWEVTLSHNRKVIGLIPTAAIVLKLPWNKKQWADTCCKIFPLLRYKNTGYHTEGKKETKSYFNCVILKGNATNFKSVYGPWGARLHFYLARQRDSQEHAISQSRLATLHACGWTQAPSNSARCWHGSNNLNLDTDLEMTPRSFRLKLLGGRKSLTSWT